MKKYLIFSIIISIIVTSGIKVYGAVSLREMDYIHKITILNNQTKYDLIVDVKHRSGDLNYEFLRQFKNYQRVIIGFAQNELEYGLDENITKLAEEIILERKEVLKKMEKVVKEVEANLLPDKVKESAYFSCYDEIYQELMGKIQTEKEIEASISNHGMDRDFLGRMTTHFETMNKMLITVDTFTDLEIMKELIKDISQSNQVTMEKVYKLVSQIDEKEDGS